MKAATEFAQELIGAASPTPMADQPFVRAVIRGELSREALKSYAVDTFAVASSFPLRISAVLSICDHPEVRRSLIANLLEEEGVVGFVPAEGLRIEPARRHGEMARRFARAAGASPAELERSIGAPVRWFQQAIERGNWIGAFAYFAIGHEANVPSTFRMLVGPLQQHYGLTEHDLEFLIEHFTADERHGLESAHLIARIADTPESREQAVEGARRGGAAWRAFHRARAAERALA